MADEQEYHKYYTKYYKKKPAPSSASGSYNLNYNPYPWRTWDKPDTGMADLIKSLMEKFQTGYSEAREANIGRYEDILGGYEKRFADVMEQISGMGESERGRINERFTGLRSQAHQGLVSSGLSGSTLSGGVATGIERGRSSALGELAERLMGRRASAISGLTGDKLKFMERREDEYPMYDKILSLLGMLGQHGERLQGGGSEMAQQIFDLLRQAG